MVQDRAKVKVCHLYNASMNYYTSEALNMDHTVFFIPQIRHAAFTAYSSPESATIEL